MTKNLIKNIIIPLVIIAFSSVGLANNVPIQCQVVINKNPLWNKEDVKIDIVDFNTKKIIQSLMLSAQTTKVPSINTFTQVFDCNQSPKIQIQASYTPSVWSTDKGKVYVSKDIYDLTNQLLSAPSKGIQTLTITLTFPEDFIGIPLLINN